MELAIETIARKEGEARGEARGVIRLMRDMGADEDAIVLRLMKQLRVGRKRAEQYVRELDCSN